MIIKWDITVTPEVQFLCFFVSFLSPILRKHSDIIHPRVDRDLDLIKKTVSCLILRDTNTYCLLKLSFVWLFNIHRSIYLSVCLSVCLHVCLSIYPIQSNLIQSNPIYSIYLTIYIYLSIYLSICLPTSSYLFYLFYLFYLSIFLSIYVSMYLSIYLSICLSI